jgi:hypothetical protein
MKFADMLRIVMNEPVFHTGLLLVSDVDPVHIRRQLGWCVNVGKFTNSDRDYLPWHSRISRLDCSSFGQPNDYYILHMLVCSPPWLSWIHPGICAGNHQRYIGTPSEGRNAVGEIPPSTINNRIKTQLRTIWWHRFRRVGQRSGMLFHASNIRWVERISSNAW